MKAKIIGTCSHEIGIKWFNSGKSQICIEDKDREGKSCISFMIVCPKCLGWYQKEELIVKLVKIKEKCTSRDTALYASLRR
ncbi:MAG: hypothetical protein E3J87_02190 [Candidatus Cloacimonadota bacterium]|nr:MAG: hypothetical protein E3J87_02190 [Candidatus Cloacimonadota bacterium]